MCSLNQYWIKSAEGERGVAFAIPSRSSRGDPVLGRWGRNRLSVRMRSVPILCIPPPKCP